MTGSAADTQRQEDVLPSGILRDVSWHCPGGVIADAFLFPVFVNPDADTVRELHRWCMTARHAMGDIGGDPRLLGLYDGVALRACLDAHGNVFVVDAWLETHSGLVSHMAEAGHSMLRDRFRMDRDGVLHDMGCAGRSGDTRIVPRPGTVRHMPRPLGCRTVQDISADCVRGLHGRRRATPDGPASTPRM